MNKKWFVLNLSNNLIKSYYFSPYKKLAMRHSNKRIQLNISHIHANRSVKKIEEYIDSYFPFLQKGNPANFGVQRWYLRPGFDCVKGGQECKNFYGKWLELLPEVDLLPLLDLPTYTIVNCTYVRMDSHLVIIID